MIKGFLDPIRNIAKRAANLSEGELLFFVWTEPLVQDQIVYLNTQVQLFGKQQRADGSEMPRYSNFTLELKPANFPENITLLDTGDFYASFTVTPLSDGFEINADTKKEDRDLAAPPEEGYGPEIIGLQEESMESLAVFIEPFIKEKILQILLGLSFS